MLVCVCVCVLWGDNGSLCRGEGGEGDDGCLCRGRGEG